MPNCNAPYLWIAGGVLCFGLAITNPSQAQIISDGTLPTEVTSADNQNFVITGGSPVGANLFHSFREFSVPDAGSALFDNPSDIQNVISRVTGGSLSTINGLLEANGDANLFLINPQGIVFGPNAQLRIGGSFLASTANALTFADGTVFSAAPLQTQPLLTLSIPVGLQFGEAPGTIINQSRTAVESGRTLALVGGGVRLEGGRLTASGGRVELGSVAGPGSVSLTPTDEGWILGYEGAQNFQDIHLTQSARVTTSGNRGGAIQFRGRDIVITGNSIVQAQTGGTEAGAPLSITAEGLEVSNQSILSTAAFGSGNGGDIAIATERLVVRDGGQIQTSTFGDGAGGTLRVSASDSIVLFGRLGFSRLTTLTNGPGPAGQLQIETGTLSVRDGSQISTSTFGAGNAGRLVINAAGAVEVVGRNASGIRPSGLFAQTSDAQARGNGGDLEIYAQRLTVTDGAAISVGAVRGSTGQGGELIIRVADVVEVVGTGVDQHGQQVPSIVLSETQGPGDAGDLTVETSRFVVRDGARVSASTSNGGAGGTLTVRADTVELIGTSIDGQLVSGLFASTEPTSTGNGGSIIVTAPQVLIRDRAGIDVNSQGSGQGGDIELQTGTLTLDHQGFLSAATASSQGGNIRLDVNGILQMSENSLISARAGAGGDGGNIDINTLFLIAAPDQNNDIIASAVEGRGGNIAIATQGLFGLEERRAVPGNQTNDIDASSEFGVSGVVEINELGGDPRRGLAPLPSNPTDPASLIDRRCEFLARPGASTFVVTGRGGLPPDPSDRLGEEGLLEDLGPDVVQEGNRIGERRSWEDGGGEGDRGGGQAVAGVEAQGWLQDAEGRIHLVAASGEFYGSSRSVANCSAISEHPAAAH